MGAWEDTKGYWNSAQPYLDPGNLLAGGPKQTDTGTVGAARPEDISNFQPIPGTDYAYDPVSGQYYQTQYTDPTTGQKVSLQGSQVAAAPNLAQQTSGLTANQQLYVNRDADIQARMAATRAGQGGLERDYQGAIKGTAPSVASTQLLYGMNQIAQDQNAQAAGANGQNAFAARRAAAMATAGAQGDLSGQQALVRANEVAAARAGLSSLYGTEASADATASNTAATTGLGYAKTAEEAEADRVNANTLRDAEYNKQRASVLQGAGTTVAGIFGAG